MKYDSERISVDKDDRRKAFRFVDLRVFEKSLLVLVIDETGRLYGKDHSEWSFLEAVICPSTVQICLMSYWDCKLIFILSIER